MYITFCRDNDDGDDDDVDDAALRDNRPLA